MSEVQQTEVLNPHSVKICRTENGKTSITVKCYGRTTQEAAEEASRVFDEMSTKYSIPQ